MLFQFCAASVSLNFSLSLLPFTGLFQTMMVRACFLPRAVVGCHPWAALCKGEEERLASERAAFEAQRAELEALRASHAAALEAQRAEMAQELEAHRKAAADAAAAAARRSDLGAYEDAAAAGDANGGVVEPFASPPPGSPLGSPEEGQQAAGGDSAGEPRQFPTAADMDAEAAAEAAEAAEATATAATEDVAEREGAEAAAREAAAREAVERQRREAENTERMARRERDRKLGFHQGRHNRSLAALLESGFTTGGEVGPWSRTPRITVVVQCCGFGDLGSCFAQRGTQDTSLALVLSLVLLCSCA